MPLLQRFGSTKLIYFMNTSHNAAGHTSGYFFREYVPWHSQNWHTGQVLLPKVLNKAHGNIDNDDLDVIEGTFDEKLDEKLGERLSRLPTKDEVYGTMDEVIGLLRTIREEQAVKSHQLSVHGDRIDKIESHWAYYKISSRFPSGQK
jgi:hypothetical protein